MEDASRSSAENTRKNRTSFLPVSLNAAFQQGFKEGLKRLKYRDEPLGQLCVYCKCVYKREREIAALQKVLAITLQLQIRSRFVMHTKIIIKQHR